MMTKRIENLIGLKVFLFILAGFIGGQSVSFSVRAAEPETPLQQGEDAMGDDNDDLAIKCFSDAIRLNPGDVNAYFFRGLANEDKYRHNEAIADFCQAIRLNPKNVQAFEFRGMCYIETAHYDQAIADLSRAIKLNPEDSEAYGDRGAAFLQQQHYDKALSDFDEAIRLDSKNVSAYTQRGTLYVLKNEPKEAIADFDQATRLDPKDTYAYVKLAWIFATSPELDLRDGKKAVECATTACGLSGWKDFDAWETLAVAYAADGNFLDAVKWEKKFLESAKPTGSDKALSEKRLETFQAHLKSSHSGSGE
jgi:tetratricopeptide (TPR) repeat protein